MWVALHSLSFLFRALNSAEVLKKVTPGWREDVLWLYVQPYSWKVHIFPHVTSILFFFSVCDPAAGYSSMHITSEVSYGEIAIRKNSRHRGTAAPLSYSLIFCRIWFKCTDAVCTEEEEVGSLWSLHTVKPNQTLNATEEWGQIHPAAGTVINTVKRWWCSDSICTVELHKADRRDSNCNMRKMLRFNTNTESSRAAADEAAECDPQYVWHTIWTCECLTPLSAQEEQT